MKPTITANKIAKEWDALAEMRYEDLANGRDKSYSEILKPTLIRLLKNSKSKSILDIGCGVGVLTEELAKIFLEVTAIDLSPNSIQIAKMHTHSSNINFQCIDFNDFLINRRFDVILSNMTLMTMPDLSNFFNKIEKLISKNGKFIFSITHPSFWPIYWNYTDNGFEYLKETEIIREFKMRNKIYNNFFTRHYHRPISFYIDNLFASNLMIQKFLELKGKKEENWYPRFIVIVCQKKERNRKSD